MNEYREKNHNELNIGIKNAQIWHGMKIEKYCFKKTYWNQKNQLQHLRCLNQHPKKQKLLMKMIVWN